MTGSSLDTDFHGYQMVDDSHLCFRWEAVRAIIEEEGI